MITARTSSARCREGQPPIAVWSAHPRHRRQLDKIEVSIIQGAAMINIPLTTSDPAAGSHSDPTTSLRPVLQLGAIALPVGWLLLSLPLLLDLPLEPFVLGT